MEAFMDKGILIERDILYPTDSVVEPGCVHVQVFEPDKNNKIPVVIEEKTAHSPLKYIATIAKIIQNDIFDRIFIDIKKNSDIYIKANEELAKEFGNYNYIKVTFADDGVSAEGFDW